MEKAKYWQAVLYPENMVENWQEDISRLIELPFAYCIHDKCICKDGSNRNIHVHLIIAFPNTTTYKHALNVFKRLQKEGCIAIPNDIIQSVINIRRAFDYLIHDTEDCKKKNKYLYPVQERITGNGFDIGNFEQLSVAEKNQIAKQLCDIIITNNYCNFSDFYMDVVSNYDTSYFEILKTNSGLFERLTKGNYQRLNFALERENQNVEN